MPPIKVIARAYIRQPSPGPSHIFGDVRRPRQSPFPGPNSLRRAPAVRAKVHSATLGDVCGPERDHSNRVHCLRLHKWAIYPCFSYEIPTLAAQLQTQTPVHPRYCVEGAEKKRAYSTPPSLRDPTGERAYKGAQIPAQPYERSYSALRLCTLSCENSDPKSRGRPQGGGRVGAETIDQSPGDGTLRRAAGGSAAWAADPRPGVQYMGGGHTCTPSWEVPSGHLAVHTGGRTPKHDGSDDRTVGVGNHDWERNEKGQRTEAIERPTGDGVHRRAAGDAAARSAHPCPDHRPLSPSASGVPVHSRAQATNGG